MQIRQRFTNLREHPLNHVPRHRPLMDTLKQRAIINVLHRDQRRVPFLIVAGVDDADDVGVV